MVSDQALLRSGKSIRSTAGPKHACSRESGDYQNGKLSYRLYAWPDLESMVEVQKAVQTPVHYQLPFETLLNRQLRWLLRKQTNLVVQLQHQCPRDQADFRRSTGLASVQCLRNRFLTPQFSGVAQKFVFSWEHVPCLWCSSSIGTWLQHWPIDSWFEHSLETS